LEFRAAERSESSRASDKATLLKDWWIVIRFLMPLVLCIIAVASVAIGVAAAYIAVFGILSSFDRPPQPESTPDRSRLALVASQHHAGGD